MKKYKLALIGCGFLNEIVANALDAGFLPEYELVAVLGRDVDRARMRPTQHAIDEQPRDTRHAADFNVIPLVCSDHHRRGDEDREPRPCGKPDRPTR